jgi:hypothetical protein
VAGATISAGYRLSTAAPGGDTAIACIEFAGDVAGALRALGIETVAVGEYRLRDLAGIDRGVVARWSAERATLMPHAGPAVVRRLLAACAAAGLTRMEGDDPRVMYPEAATDLEARMLSALARAASPLAVDMLLDQPRRWGPGPLPAGDSTERDRVLMRLIEPALVVTAGPPNIGKSSLLNALAGRTVALVADVPGTTRDHVGVMVDLGGLVVRWGDTPGLTEKPADAVEVEAQRLAGELIGRADLVLNCGDATAPPPAARRHGLALTIGLRADRGPCPGAEVSVSALTGAGLPELVQLIRETLVPAAAMADPAPWRFW